MVAITQGQLDTSVWGTGYGSKKHLVDHGRSKIRAPGPRWTYDEIHVRCSTTITVDALDSGGPMDQGIVATRQPCARCRKIADAEGRP